MLCARGPAYWTGPILHRSYDAAITFAASPQRKSLPMFQLRPLSALFLFACTLPALAAEECVARFDAGVARYQEAVAVQKGRETANWQELNGLLCQGRLDLLDMEFALVDDYEQCARNGGKFPEQTARAMQARSDNLAARKSAWIDTCGPYMKQ